MGRRVEYLCDQCKRVFGDAPHINVKNGDIRISYINAKQNWVQNRFPIQCKEYHFCDMTCLERFLHEKFCEAMAGTQPKSG